jgi:hypothetical protein
MVYVLVEFCLEEGRFLVPDVRSWAGAEVDIGGKLSCMYVLVWILFHLFRSVSKVCAGSPARAQAKR